MKKTLLLSLCLVFLTSIYSQQESNIQITQEAVNISSKKDVNILPGTNGKAYYNNNEIVTKNQLPVNPVLNGLNSNDVKIEIDGYADILLKNESGILLFKDFWNEFYHSGITLESKFDNSISIKSAADIYFTTPLNREFSLNNQPIQTLESIKLMARVSGIIGYDLYNSDFEVNKIMLYYDQTPKPDIGITGWYILYNWKLPRIQAPHIIPLKEGQIVKNNQTGKLGRLLDGQIREIDLYPFTNINNLELSNSSIGLESSAGTISMRGNGIKISSGGELDLWSISNVNLSAPNGNINIGNNESYDINIGVRNRINLNAGIAYYNNKEIAIINNYTSTAEDTKKLWTNGKKVYQKTTPFTIPAGGNIEIAQASAIVNSYGTYNYTGGTYQQDTYVIGYPNEAGEKSLITIGKKGNTVRLYNLSSTAISGSITLEYAIP